MRLAHEVQTGGLHFETISLRIETIIPHAPDETTIDWLAAVMSHATGSEQRWALVRLAAHDGSFTHGRAKEELGLASSGGLATHLDPLLNGFILEKDGRGYRLTPWGEFVYDLLTYGAIGTPGSDLVGKRLLAVTRPDAVDPRAVMGILQSSARATIRTDGTYRYLAIYDDEPDLVEDLLFAVHELGAEGVVLRVSQVE